MDVKLLKEVGLTEGEIKSYLALLKLGPSSTGPIAKESQLTRSKLYEILDKLGKKGLVSKYEKKGVIQFQAEDPKRIIDYINNKESNLKKLKSDVETFLPKLRKISDSKSKVQKVGVYQGLKGMITAHEHAYDKLKKGDEINVMGIVENQPEIQQIYWQKDHLRRDKAGIKVKMLFNKDTPKEILKNRNKYKLCESRYMHTNIKTPAFFELYNDTVNIGLVADDPIVVEISSKDIYNAFKEYFDEFWKRSKPFK